MPTTRSLKRIEPPRLKTWEKFFLPQIAEGLGVTARHIAGVMFANKAITMQYPEEQHVPSPNYRGVHRLNKDEQGRVKCVACMLCATACPAHCIDIVGATAPATWPDREKYPENFVIDELRCIYCGMCEEACPVEAIELTGLYDLTGLVARRDDLRQDQAAVGFRPDQGPGADALRQAAGRASLGDPDPTVAGVISGIPSGHDTARSDMNTTVPMKESYHDVDRRCNSGNPGRRTGRGRHLSDAAAPAWAARPLRQYGAGAIAASVALLVFLSF